MEEYPSKGRLWIMDTSIGIYNPHKPKRGFEKISKEQWVKDSENFYYYKEDNYDEIILPKRATAKSAGYDIFAPYDIVLDAGCSIKVCTGIKSYMLDDERLSIYPRSGLGFKFFLRLANTVGIVDSDYFNNERTEGHIYIKIRNEGDYQILIKKGEAFAQAIFEKYLLADGDDYTGAERKGGLGST